MSATDPLLLDVWREACRHIELDEAVTTLAPRLAATMPLDALIVRRLDLHAPALATRAACRAGGGEPGGAVRTELDEAALEELLAWLGGDELLHGSSGLLRRRAPGLVPDGLSGEVLAGPLAGGAVSTGGALLLVARRGEHFERAHLRAAGALLEPFAVALENDARLHALASLREAAEADRRSLLTRLGREDLADTVVGAEGGLRPVMERIELVAGSDVPVLLLGETGSGKEVAARAIHVRSRRADGPFLRVNCGAIPHGLIDSQLFGHERGSFSSAVSRHRGWFERADGGTLFLDEVGELPPDAQVRLLRVLQDGCFERVGGDASIHVDVRVVAATHRDLRAMTREGDFREDLWYRLAVFPVALPPLRERPEDIPALATHLALRACKRFGMPPAVPDAADTERLAAYAWPGNVRELASVLERAVLLGAGRGLDVATALGMHPEPTPAPPRSPEAPDAARRFPTFDEAARAHVERALERCAGRIEGAGGAAQLLDVNPHTLRARMRRLGIDWRAYRAR